ncbi:acyl-CoA thioester hydrolase/BAAT C-terminal domain-containing protein [Bifidobacterium aesculapii]|uniref:acyl-CoA thioester hydrolase/BAAT C-terminal domain-containing protein n=1 Tax=Bifidobacterium aesculapii TaxID=1329411 RepID=UPI0006E23BBB|nr:acyl-CoA thioester hydrolase/BAAT C-terminal domain-containing protein [Bifidobacterium aesculapii]
MTIDITPRDALISTPRRIVISDYEPNTIIVVDARTERAHGAWSSRNYYLTGLDGTVDLDTTAPVWGDGDAKGYDTPLWSQSPEEGVANGSFSASPDQPLITTLTVSTLQGESETATFTQRFLTDGVRRTVLSGEIEGHLYTPATQGPYPTVLLLNGSDGGFSDHRAALYASVGIQTLTLAYFNAEHLSPWISETHIEYFEKGFDYLHSLGTALNDRVIVSGQSRGGELTLLLASLLPDKIFGAVAYTPGAFVHSAQTSKAPEADWKDPAWIRGGEALPNLFHDNPYVEGNPFLHNVPRYEDHNGRNTVFIDAQRSREHVERARIHVENINGPVLLVSGTNDKVWPASFASRYVKNQLEAAGHPYEVTHLDYVGAGHSIGLPTVPRVLTSAHPVSGTVSYSGGTALGNALASDDAFDKTVDFIYRAALTPLAA